jgi:hypothetical protein
MIKWISTEEELPELEKVVLVHIESLKEFGICSAILMEESDTNDWTGVSYDNKVWVPCDDAFKVPNEEENELAIKHWAELPNLPL